MEKRISKSKKGNVVIDSFLVILFICVLGIVLFFGFKILSSVNSSIQADSSFDTYSKSELQSYTTKTQVVFDNLFIVVFILLWIVTLVASFYIDAHPIFFGLSLILLLFIFWLTPMIGNAVETIMIDSEISGTVALFPKANWILTHLLTVAIVVGSSILLTMFAKNQQY